MGKTGKETSVTAIKMPKSCAAPECKRKERKRVSYYKFPLHDKDRLQQWLTNMNKDNFVPSKHHRLCSEHFKTSCFQYRWGVRFLKLDAVPTIFPSAEASSTSKHVAKTRKLPSAQKNIKAAGSVPLASGSGTVEAPSLSEIMEAKTVTITLDSSLIPGQVYIDGAEALAKGIDALAIPNPVTGTVNLVPLVHIVEPFNGLSLALPSFQAQGASPLSLPIGGGIVLGEEQIQGIPLAEPIALISEEHTASTSLQCDLNAGRVISLCREVVPTVIDMSEMSSHGALVIENMSIDPFSERDFPTLAPAQMSPAELLAYLETMQTATAIPCLQTGPLPPIMSSRETVLSPAITAPIASTVPIVSKHAKALSEPEDVCEQSSGHLEQRDELQGSLTTAQLVSIAVDLQRKAGLQPSSELPENSNTVAIVCQEDDQILTYALPLYPKEERQSFFHVEEQ
ncbi:hypothetical protein FKM82_016112 [Ascaphus truei]